MEAIQRSNVLNNNNKRKVEEVNKNFKGKGYTLSFWNFSPPFRPGLRYLVLHYVQAISGLSSSKVLITNSRRGYVQNSAGYSVYLGIAYSLGFGNLSPPFRPGLRYLMLHYVQAISGLSSSKASITHHATRFRTFIACFTGLVYLVPG